MGRRYSRREPQKIHPTRHRRGGGAGPGRTGQGNGDRLGASAPGAAPAGKFKLKYAPSIGAFQGPRRRRSLAQIAFAADEGFRAMFDNGIMNRPAAQQEAIVREIAKRGMVLGPFVLYADFGKKSYVTRDKDVREMLLQKMSDGVETA